MPDGTIHLRLWKGGLMLALPLTVVTTEAARQFDLIYICYPPLCIHGAVFVALGVPLGYVYGAFIDPDMDIVGMTKADGRLMNKLGIIGGLLVSYWTFYGYLFRRKHRSIWTHGPVISTAIRYTYQYWCPFIYLYLTSKQLGWVVLLFIGMFIGTTLSDTIHYAADKISGELKRR